MAYPRKKTESRPYALGLTVLISFMTGALISGSLVAYLYSSQPIPQAQALRQSDISTSTGYAFIDPLIGIRGVGNGTAYADLQSQLESYIATQNNNGLITASVDFRDIKASGGFTINPTELYTPASLYKVPLMMVYYKLAESDPSILDQQLLYTGSPDLDAPEQIKSVIQLVPGTRYTVEQLIEHLIRYSDNNAVQLLVTHLQDINHYQDYVSLFTSFGIDPSTLNETADTITVQNYSLFLRELYNATYLDRDDSERSLSLLTKTDFTQGIDSGVPNNVPVAQKFGETYVAAPSGALIGKELSNCGIVYYSDHPYLLCIMLKGQGDNVTYLESVLSAISRIAYQYMQKQYPES